MFTVEEILKATGGRLLRGIPHGRILGISIDSRTIKPGELFVAIRGQRFDGVQFVVEALQKGASGVVVRQASRPTKTSQPVPADLSSEASAKEGPFVIIEVPDTVKAFGDIAHFHRKRFDIPVVGVTGSNGKTTTKDMTASFLERQFNVLKSKGTENNFIGVPKTLLQLNSEHQACVLEMGTNQSGEIKRLTQISEPNIGVITNIGPSHLEFLGDLDSVFNAKVELFEHFKEKDLALLNGDDGMLASLRMGTKFKRKTFGLGWGCDFSASQVRWEGSAWEFILNNRYKMRLNLLGRHNIYNCLASIGVASVLGLGPNEIQNALNSFKAPPMRMEIVQFRDVILINDCYNSNPQSMGCAIEVLSAFKTKGKKILVSGDMLELGEVGEYFHYRVGKDVASSGIDVLMGVGLMSEHTTEAALKSGMKEDAIRFCDSPLQAGQVLAGLVEPGDVILVKGSRAMKMEKVIECFTTYYIR